MDTKELWQAVLGELELKLSKANFTTWFRNTFIITFDEQGISIAVPNTFTKSWLEKKYHKDILSLLQNFSNKNIRKIIYQVETTIKPIAQPIPCAATFPPTPPSINQSAPSVSAYQLSSSSSFPFEKNTPPTIHDLSLNPKYQFESFIVGKQNELSHAAALAVTNQPGEVYNPLFIYGGVGLGKTHLLQAIGNELKHKRPETKVLYVTCERFTNEFIHAVRNGRAKEFKDIYRTVDLLLIDDVQFIASKEGTQEELFHTFNTLHQNNKQIVLSSDRPAKAIPSLESRLRSRFEWGMMVDVGSPDFETRVAILEAKCCEKNYFLSGEILHHVATLIQNNIRELEGALNKIIAIHQFKNMVPSIETVHPILLSFQPTKTQKNITAKYLIQTVSSYFDLSIEEMLGKSREKRLAFPRQIIMFLMREEMKCSYPAIGAELGGRDHTTAMHAHEKIQNCLLEDERLQNDLELIKQELYN